MSGTDEKTAVFINATTWLRSGDDAGDILNNFPQTYLTIIGCCDGINDREIGRNEEIYIHISHISYMENILRSMLCPGIVVSSIKDAMNLPGFTSFVKEVEDRFLTSYETIKIGK